jgi:hypothetical protein
MIQETRLLTLVGTKRFVEMEAMHIDLIDIYICPTVWGVEDG